VTPSAKGLPQATPTYPASSPFLPPNPQLTSDATKWLRPDAGEKPKELRL
jgi:hypothetical protein